MIASLENRNHINFEQTLISRDDISVIKENGDEFRSRTRRKRGHPTSFRTGLRLAPLNLRL